MKGVCGVFSAADMSKLKAFKKILTFALCSALSLSIIAACPSKKEDPLKDVSALTLDEIQEQREANNAMIEQYESQINSLEGDKANEQETLAQQLSVMKENLTLINAEIDAINKDIADTEANITQLDEAIVAQQDKIDESVELFKERLCALYVSGNENLAAVVLGSSSFYDILSRVEMANRMAAYDEELIDDILADIDDLEITKSDLEKEKLSLEASKTAQEVYKAQKADEMDLYYEKMQQTQDEIDRLAMEQQRLALDKSELEASNAAYDAQEAELREIIRQAEEERQRKIAEEAAEAARQEELRRQQELAAQQQAANNNNSSSDNSGSSYTEPDTPTPTYVAPQSNAGGFIWPVPGFCYISSGFGYRWGTNHNGIDVGDAGIMGATVVASKSGTVISMYNSCQDNYPKSSSCGCNGGYGNCVMIQHDDGTVTVYAHLTSAIASVGEYVSQGQPIGYVGTTGWSTGAHLHFEIRIGGVPVDPLGYVSP